MPFVSERRRSRRTTERDPRERSERQIRGAARIARRRAEEE